MKNKYYFLLFLCFVSVAIYSQSAPLIEVKINVPVPACAPGGSLDLLASYTPVKKTNDYSVSPLVYNPTFPFLWDGVGNHRINATGDDTWSPIVTLPFNFNFYGFNYTQVLIGTNGLITFDLTNNTPGGTCPWSYNGAIPNPAFPVRNAIFGVYQDTNIAIPPVQNPLVQNVNYYILDTGANAAPNRVLVVNFNNLPQYSCGTSVGLQTSQIVLHERTNIVDINVSRRTPCTNWNPGSGNGNGVMGFLNAAGNLAEIAHNTGNWSVLNGEGWRFTPIGAPITTKLTWKKNGVALSATTDNVNPLTVTIPDPYLTPDIYTATVTYTPVLPETPFSAFKDITVSLETPLSVLTPENKIICNSSTLPMSFDINQTPYVLNGAVSTDYDITYYPINTNPIFPPDQNAKDDVNMIGGMIGGQVYIGTSPTPHPLTYPINIVLTSATTQTIFVRITNSLTGCVNIRQFDIIFDANPISSPSAPQLICVDGTPSPFSVTTTFTGVNPVKFVAFTTPQTGTTMYTGGDLLGFGNLSGTIATYIPTALGTPGSLPNIPNSLNTTGTYYVYAIENAATTSACFPFQEIQVVVKAKETASVTCGISTASSVSFTWTNATGATGYTIAYELNASGTLINATPSGNTFNLTGLSPGDNVKLVVTPTGPTNRCFDPSQFTCTAGNCPTLTASSNLNQTICINGNPTAFAVNTSLTGTNEIKFVYFTTPQNVGATIYSSGTPLATTTPISGIASLDLATLGTGSLPNIAGTYFIYAIENTTTPSGCTKFVEFQVEVKTILRPIISCGTSTTSSVVFTWPNVSGATDYMVSYQINTNPTIFIGTIGRVTTYSVTGLASGDTVTITITPTSTLLSVCFDSSVLQCTASPCPTILTPSTSQTLCSGDDPSAMSVTTTFTGGGSIQFVYFATPQTGGAMYSGGTLLGSVTPGSGVATYDPPALGTLNSLPNVAGTYYVYVIANPTPVGSACRPFQEIILTITQKPVIANKTAQICSGTAFTVTPIATDVVPSGTTYSWATPVSNPIGAITGGTSQTGQTTISQNLMNTTAYIATLKYVVTAKNGSCTNTFEVLVTVNARPLIANTTNSTCSGNSFSITPTLPDIVPATTVYTWASAPVSNPVGAITGGLTETTGTTNFILIAPLTNATATSAIALYTITATNGSGANACASTFTFAVTVAPRPIIANSNQQICSGTPFTMTPQATDIVPSGTTYTWGTPLSNPIGAISGGSSGSNQNTISQNLTNATLTNATLTYTVTATNPALVCSNTFAITITVVPKPIIGLTTQRICSGGTFIVPPTTGSTDVIPANTKYTWTTPNTLPLNAITGAVSQAVSQNNITGTLVNTTAAVATASYDVAATTISGTSTCSSTFQIVVTVNPVATIAAKTALICNGTFSITPSSPEIVPTGTTYSWALPSSNPIGVITGGNPQTGVGLFSQTLMNTSSENATITYNVVASSGTITPICSSTFTININVTPNPSIASKIAAICSGSSFTITPTASDIAPVGTSYSWPTPISSPAGTVTGGSAQSGQPTISQNLVNASLSSAQLVYTVTASNGVCTSIFTVTVTVNPKPIITDKTAQICGGTVFIIQPAAPDTVPSGTTYSWSLPTSNPLGAITGISIQNNQITISQSLTNSISATATATYSVTASSGVGTNACTGSFLTTITVVPNPVIANNTQQICSGTPFSFTPLVTDVVPSGTTYSWPVPVSNPVGVISGGFAQSGQPTISQSLINTSLTPAQLVYTVTASNGICTNVFNVTVTVNPQPIITNKTAQICGGTVFNIQPAAPDTVPTGTTYSWSLPTSNPLGAITGTSTQNNQITISQSLTNITSATATATYSVTASSGLGSNTCTSSFLTTITVVPNPIITASAQQICSGTTFTVMPLATDVVPTGTTYTWSNPVIYPAGAIIGSSAQTASSTISETLTNSTSANATAAYFITASVGSGSNVCSNTFSVTITVTPNPNITPKTVTICSGSNFTVTPTNTTFDVVPAGTTFTWTLPTSNPVTAIIGGLAQANGQRTISQNLVNTTDAAATLTYTVTASIGSGVNTCISTFIISITVNPKATITPKTTTICSGTSFSLTPITDVAIGDSVPTGTTYTWTLPTSSPLGAINGGLAQPVGQFSISETNGTLLNTTVSSGSLLYAVTATSGMGSDQCSMSFPVTVTINPLPIIASIATPIIICSETPFTVVTSLSDMVPTGTTYTWTVTNNAVVSGASDVTTATSIISQTLTNTSNTFQTVVYSITPKSGLCDGASFTATISIAPKPSISNVIPTAICSGTSFTVTPINLGGVVANDVVPSGTTYTWTVLDNLNITGEAASLAPNTTLTQTLTNTSNAVQTVVYTLTPVSGNCNGSPFTVTVTVNPKPTIASSLQNICSGTAFTVTPTHLGGTFLNDIVPIGTVYTWPTPITIPGGIITGGSAEAFGLPTISQTLNNTFSSDGLIRYTVTPVSVSTGGCPGAPFTITVKIKPVATVIVPASVSQIYCSGTLTNAIQFTGNSINTSYQWTNDTPSINLAASGVGPVIPAFKALNLGTSVVTATVTVTPISVLGCIGIVQTFTITVNPLPVVVLRDGAICIAANGSSLPNSSHVFNTALDPTVYSFVWYNNAGVILNQTQPTYEAIATGVYSVKVTNNATGCVSFESGSVIGLLPPATAVVYQNDYFGDNQTISVSVSPIGNYEYQLDNGAFQESNFFMNLTSGIDNPHIIRVRNIYGCDITIPTLPFYIHSFPKVFTPNEDGYNDSWNIGDLSDQPDARIYIFDRLGKLLKEIFPSGNGWNGTFNGLPQPAEDYWFRVSFKDQDGNSKEFKSHFTLKR